MSALSADQKVAIFLKKFLTDNFNFAIINIVVARDSHNLTARKQVNKRVSAQFAAEGF
ncbi:hypothetical protein [uncultured Pseudoramibacter sp.]|uniref:hypothetical protein n=1 Tax=uncultured Pseudoramibacter sp. TaxID=1623493 RepID=UPI0025E6F98C|nr:hypothetical protein [uncultured Pseudoramibacter sp.]